MKFVNSVLGPVPVDRIRHGTVCPCRGCRPKKHGGTGVPTGTGIPCHFAARPVSEASTRTGPRPVQSGPGFHRSSPVQDRSQTRPILGPPPPLIRSSVQAGPIRSGPGPVTPLIGSKKLEGGILPPQKLQQAYAAHPTIVTCSVNQINGEKQITQLPPSTKDW